MEAAHLIVGSVYFILRHLSKPVDYYVETLVQVNVTLWVGSASVATRQTHRIAYVSLVFYFNCNARFHSGACHSQT